jgi:bacterial/archaeal transporter family-2 protein
MTQILLGLMAVAAGVASAFQAAANAGLSLRIGLAAALVVNTSIVLLATLGFYFARVPQESFFGSGAPWSFYVGGICGFFFLLSLALVVPRIGTAVAIALVVLGQGVAALAIDHYGLMGMPTEPITLARVAGLLLLGGGVALIRA